MKITFIGKVTAHKLVEKKEQVEDGEPIVHEGLELTVDAEASHLSDLCAADAKSKVRLLVRKSDAEIEAWSNGILNTPPEDRAEMCAEDPSVLDVPAEHIRRLKARLAAAPSGEPDALTRGERAELLAWRRANDLRADWEAHLNARDEAWRLRAENEAASGRVSEKAVRSSDSDPADMSPEQWDALVGVAGASVNPDDDAPPAGRAAAEVARLTRRTGELEKMLRFLSTYEKNPPEIVYDEWAYKRFLNFVHECAARALSGAAPTEGAES